MTVSTVYPSGGDFATSSAPTMLFAPGLFSMTMGCPMLSWTFCATRRVTVSVIPPGVYGTIHLIGLDGYWAAAGNATMQRAASQLAKKVFMLRCPRRLGTVRLHRRMVRG